MTQTAPDSAKVAYLTGHYPAISHTFILREVETLRDLGREVVTCSVRSADPAHLKGAVEQAEHQRTFYLLAAARRPATLLAAMGMGLRTPGALWRMFRLAWRTRSPGARAALYQLFYMVEALVLGRHLRAQGVTHIHNHFAGPSATVAMLTSELTGIPYSFTLHGPADLLEGQKWRLDEKVARARFVACISHFARSQLMFFSDPAHWDRLRIIHCGIQPERYDRPQLPRAPGPLRLAFVGRFAPAKGLRVLLEAVQIARAQGTDLHLTLVGDGPDRAALETLAAPMGEAVTFTGYQTQDEVAETMAQMDVFVMASFAEGVPVVLMEAMASGKPVIATRIAGIAELVQDGVNGALVAPGDAAGLAQAITAMASDPDSRSRMGAEGRRKVQAEFDIRAEARRLDRLLAGDLGPTPRPA